MSGLEVGRPVEFNHDGVPLKGIVVRYSPIIVKATIGHEENYYLEADMKDLKPAKLDLMRYVASDRVDLNSVYLIKLNDTPSFVKSELTDLCKNILDNYPEEECYISIQELLTLLPDLKGEV